MHLFQAYYFKIKTKYILGATFILFMAYVITTVNYIHRSNSLENMFYNIITNKILKKHQHLHKNTHNSYKTLHKFVPKKKKKYICLNILLSTKDQSQSLFCRKISSQDKCSFI